jgi:hypothetical protein
MLAEGEASLLVMGVLLEEVWGRLIRELENVIATASGTWIVALDICVVDVELGGLGFDFVAVDHVMPRQLN